jgi:hypothetical protein
MACGSCGGNRAPRRIVTATRSYAGPGGFPLVTYKDCTTLHLGAHQGTSIYIVGRGTEDEKLFPRTQLTEASVYARQTKRQLENIPTTALCDQAVVDVYG